MNDQQNRQMPKYQQEFRVPGENGLPASGGNAGLSGAEVQAIMDRGLFSRVNVTTEAEKMQNELEGKVGRVGIRVSNQKKGLFASKKQQARSMTEEIDQMTDLAMQANVNKAFEQDRPLGYFDGSMVNKNIMAEQQNYVGNGAAEQKNNQPYNNFNNERNELRQAEVEIREDERELAGELAGTETTVEAQEYLQADAEDLLMEQDKDVWGHDILTKGLKGLSNEAVKAVEEIIKEDKPLKIEEFRNQGMNKVLALYGRKFGRAS